MKKTPLLVAIVVASIFVLASTITPTDAWSNGGYSTDRANPVYGTHDWIAQHALDWLPANEKQYIIDNLAAYLYGTELPDNSQAADGIGDTARHHVYFKANGALQDDASALRASAEYQMALNFLNAKDFPDAAKTAGTMTHYIADVAVFAHVMGASTDWGTETGNVHPNYESYVDYRTSSYLGMYNLYLSFDGKLDSVAAYNATINLAKDTTFDNGGTFTCVWMSNNYDISNPIYWNRAGESLNLAVNAVADVLHTLYVSANPQATQTPNPTPTPSPMPTGTPTLTPTPTQTSTPTLTPSLNPTPTSTATVSPSSTISASPSTTSTPTENPTTTPYSSTNPTSLPTSSTVPEFSSTVVILVLAVSILTLFVKKHKLS